MKIVFKKIISFFLLSLFMAATAPRELLHELLCHHEISIPAHAEETTLAKASFKCFFLQQHFPSFTDGASMVFSYNHFLLPVDDSRYITHPDIQDGYNYFSHRGPPVGRT